MVTPPILPPGDPVWLASHVEDILDPARPIIDAHHHLWGEPRRPYLEEDYASDLASGHNVVSTVYVDCTYGYRTDGPEEYRSVGETEFATGVAVRSLEGAFGGVRMCEGVVSRVDLGIGAGAGEILQAHIQAGAGRFKGIRFSSAWDPDPDIRSTARQPPPRLLYDPKVREGAAALASLGLVLDTWVYHHQLEDVAAFAEAFPEMNIVLDHVGGPVRIGRYKSNLDEMYDVWRRGIASVARCPNVSVKLGGLGMHLGGFGFQDRPAPPSSQDLAEAWEPFIAPCLEAFGADRAMFESNFPVDNLSCSYPVLWNAFKRLASGASEQEKTALFSGTAARVYGLTAVPGGAA